MVSVIQLFVASLLPNAVVSGITWDITKDFLIKPLLKKLNAYFNKEDDTYTFLKKMYNEKVSKESDYEDLASSFYKEVSGRECPFNLVKEIKNTILEYDKELIATKISNRDGIAIGSISNVKGSVIITNTIRSNVAEYLINAQQYLKNNDYDNAAKCYKQAKMAEPSNHEAWWGLFICESYFSRYYRRLHGLSSYEWAVNQSRNIIDYAYMAIKYAPSNMASKYREAIKDDERIINSFR